MTQSPIRQRSLNGAGWAAMCDGRFVKRTTGLRGYSSETRSANLLPGMGGMIAALAGTEVRAPARV